MQIHELPIGNIEDANRLPFDTGSNSYATTFSALATAVASKTFSGLTTANKTILTAINELYSTKTTGELLRTNTVGAVSVDFNSITDGWHQIDSSYDIVNAPVTKKTGVILQTSNTAGNGSKYQLYIAPNAAEVWQRIYWYGTWTAWKMVSGKQSLTVTPGNGDIMSVGTNMSTANGCYMFINCTLQFSGNRASGTLLLRLPNIVSGTQYLTVYKTTTATFHMTNIAAGTGDIACPVAFASGDTAIITGVITY